jgi:hypothetical protein
MDRIPRHGHFILRDSHGRDVVQAVELGCVSQKRAVAALAHIGDDAADSGKHSVER